MSQSDDGTAGLVGSLAFFHFGTEEGEGEQLRKSPCMYVFDGGNGDDESIKRSDSLGRIGK